VRRQRQALPKRVNSFISWIDIALEDRNVINIYDVSLPFDLALVELKAFGKVNILRGVKANESLKVILKRGYNLTYRYYDKDKKLLHEFSIDAKDLDWDTQNERGKE
jgi:hypothetical protein